METVIKLINVHYKSNGGRSYKVQFKTIYDDNYNKKTYHIINGSTDDIVTKEEGNGRFNKLKEEYPELKILVIINLVEDDIMFKREYGHYGVYLNGKLYCTCDKMDEVYEAIRELKAIIK